MRIGIVGLGLIGGSMAKACGHAEGREIYGWDIDMSVTGKAIDEGVICGILEDSLLETMDLVIIALYPKDTIEYVTRRGDLFRKGGLVVDCGGIKELVCDTLEPFAKDKGFRFLGGHPMAGIEYSGFDHSKWTLFKNASMILTPIEKLEESELEWVSDFFRSLGFGAIKVSTPAAHDRIIAYSSQLAHVVSSAFVKSPSALEHKGFSAGSFRDLTRVARLNEHMWSELFLENKDNLLHEIDSMIGRLVEYRDALESEDKVMLKSLLKEGRERKELLDARQQAPVNQEQAPVNQEQATENQEQATLHQEK